MKKALLAFLGVTATAAVAAYLSQGLYGEKTYEPTKIAAQMCKGRFLAQEDGSTSSKAMLYCSNSRPTQARGNLIKAGATFTLASMGHLCPTDGKPADINDKLTCVDRSGTCKEPGMFPRPAETEDGGDGKVDGKFHCVDFLKLV